MNFSEVANTGLFFNLAPLLVFLPLIGMLINMIFGGKMSEKAIGTVASLASGSAFVVALLLAYSLSAVHGQAYTVPFAEWIHIGELQLDWTFRVDTLSAVMMLVVSGVGTLIHIYAIGYMHEDVRFKDDLRRFRRFFVFLNLFIAMMMILVSGDSYLMLFVGWEGVGLCSFLLIGFWYDFDTLGQKSTANAEAGKKAFIANRIGDFGFLLAIFTTFWHFGSLQFDEVFAQAGHQPATVITAITLFMLIGVTGKSAQVPLYVWLPDAMAGPTPVSALIHAATMVTAGVYLVVRSAPLYSAVPGAQYIVAMIGAVTALFAATIAVGQYDIKKVLAYSTISQLGFMVAAVGMGAYVAGIFHLATHAFFKALLFLSAGSIILGMERGHHHLAHGHDEEVFDPGDMRNMGNLRKQMPVTFWLYMAGTLALAGIFPFAGFWSKDEILLDAKLHAEHFPGVYALLSIAAFLTAFYMGRQIWMVFFGKERTDVAKHAKESPPVMTVPLMVLAALAVLGGALNLPFEGFHNLGHWLGYTLGEVEGLALDLGVAGISTILALVAIGISWLIYGRNPLKEGQPDPLKKPLGFLFTGMENKWFVDEGYKAVIITPFEKLAKFLSITLDWNFWHDWFHNSVIFAGFQSFARFLSDPVDMGIINAIADGLASLTQRSSEGLRRIQNGFVRSYALSVLLGVVAILGYLLFK
ncbi:MAG: NADH-quinone oxidoreductase subunit L [Anaerolineales bacterium]|uniref:NADH-quinone oxidoreductase subunit L n=1 Tax=Candidatus Desulfolinea nitratireducens TaxID=2841698 RepID=A0A8J6NKP7_9CHLR|nr:NADH-quinone oxidoreductase subunit L [Candidatus Desulfolinea nitratireducens]MBL6961046.1 NADH-quinone oxidoreductase subunit L [Anaerolineales bacterium]